VVQLFVSFLTAAAYVGYRQGFTIQIAGEDWIPILILGLLNTGVGCYLYFSSIGHLPVQTVAISGYLEPLSAVVFSVLFLHETMLPGQILGAVFILGGAILGERRAVKPA
jgi:drug/metabolite transporter (DMT)-like permease